MGEMVSQVRSLTYFRDFTVMRRQTAKTFVIAVLMAIAAYIALLEPAFIARPVSAKPAFMDRYNRDPFARETLRDKCTVCHIGRGGGERNDFGEAFEDAGYRITTKLREKFPQNFHMENQADR